MIPCLSHCMTHGCFVGQLIHPACLRYSRQTLIIFCSLRCETVAVAPYCQALSVLGLVIYTILYNSHYKPMKNFCFLNEETGLQSDGYEYLLKAPEINCSRDII